MTCITVNIENQMSLYDALPAVMRHVRSVPPNVVLPEVREAMITFCKRSEILRVRQEIALQRGVTRYRLCPPDDYQVVRAVCVIEGSKRLLVKPDLCSCSCGDFFMDGPDWIELLSAPSSDDCGSLVIEYVVAPSRSAVAFDALLYDQYRDAITAGALHRLMMQPDSKWSNLVLSAKWEIEFKKGIHEARTAVMKNFTNANLKMRPIRFC
jgi:hypothetical protein